MNNTCVDKTGISEQKPACASRKKTVYLVQPGYVYGDEKKARQMCDRYKKCTECYYRMWKNGRRLDQLAVAS